VNILVLEANDGTDVHVVDPVARAAHHVMAVVRDTYGSGLHAPGGHLLRWDATRADGSAGTAVPGEVLPRLQRRPSCDLAHRGQQTHSDRPGFAKITSALLYRGGQPTSMLRKGLSHGGT